jgi:hypothetical protein
MPIPTTIESLSTTAASNGPAGGEQRTLADDGLRQAYAFIRQLVTLGSNIASATTITPPSTGSVFNITGTTAITTIASNNSWDGRIVTLIFSDAVTLTHSSNLALPGSTNFVTALGTVAQFVQTGSGAWRCLCLVKSDGGTHPLIVVGFAYTPTSSQAFTATPTFDANLSNVFEFSGAMTANVTSVTITNPHPGQTISIRVKQDGTGGRTFATPSGAKILGNCGTTGNAASILGLTYSDMDDRWEGSWIPLPA